MKSKCLLIIIALVLVGFCVVRTSSSVSRGVAVPVHAASFQPAKESASDRSSKAESVPDRVAYSLVLSLIAHRETPAQDAHARAYLRQIGLKAADVDGVIREADEFAGSVKALHAEAKQIKANNPGPPNSAVKLYLQQLQQRKDAAIDHLVSRLPLRISREGVALLHQHIIDHVKPRVQSQSK